MAKKAAILAGSVALVAITAVRISGSVERTDSGVRVTRKRPYSTKLETLNIPNAQVIGGMEASSDEGGFVDVLQSDSIFSSAVEDVNAVETDEDGFLTFNDEDGDAIFVNANLAGTSLAFTSEPFEPEGAEKKAAPKKAEAKAAASKGKAKAKAAEAEEEEDEEEAPAPKKAAAKKGGDAKKGAAKGKGKAAASEDEWD